MNKHIVKRIKINSEDRILKCSYNYKISKKIKVYCNCELMFGVIKNFLLKQKRRKGKNR